MRCLLYAPGFSGAQREVYFFWDKTPYFVLASSILVLFQECLCTEAVVALVPPFPAGPEFGFLSASVFRLSKAVQTRSGHPRRGTRIWPRRCSGEALYSRQTSRSRNRCPRLCSRGRRLGRSAQYDEPRVPDAPLAPWCARSRPKISSIPSGSFTVCHTCHSARGWVRCFE